jgi:flagellar biosynthesis/type III secretory pathway ATPase
MNKEHARIMTETMKEHSIKWNKINEFNQKFFNEKDGVLSPNNLRLKNGLSVGVYAKGSGQTIDIDIKLLPVVTEFIKQLQDYYIKGIENISVDELIKKLKEIQ